MESPVGADKRPALQMTCSPETRRLCCCNSFKHKQRGQRATRKHRTATLLHYFVILFLFKLDHRGPSRLVVYLECRDREPDGMS